MQIEKNLKFNKSVSCTGTLYYNPYARIDNMELSGTFTHFSGYSTTIVTNPSDPVGFAEGDLMVFGQVVYFVYQVNGNEVTCYVPNGTYVYDGNTTVGDMVKTIDRAYIFRPYFDTGQTYSGCGWWYNNGAGHIPILCGHAGNESYVVSDVSISEYAINRNQATYGNNSHVYNTDNKYEATFTLPYKTSFEKLNQIMQSDCVVYQANDREVYDYTNDSAYRFDRVLGGSSVSPLARKVSLASDSIKMELRRNRYQITGTLEG